MPTNTIERRNLVQEFRVASAGGTPTIAGYAAVFDVPSEDMGWVEVIDAHAFDAVLAANPDCRALWNHNADHVLGRTTANTLHLTIDARGLAYVIDPPDTTVARDLMVSMQRKDVTQSSFGFITARDQWTDNPDGSVSRRILEIAELLDVSPVTYPAFTQADSGVRSLPASMPREIRSRFEARATAKACACTGAQCKSGNCGICSADPKCDAPTPAARALTDQCTCTCPQCMKGSCGICSNDPQCDGAERASQRNAAWKLNAELCIRVLES
jgi:HK97 family phage prohead protease